MNAMSELVQVLLENPNGAYDFISMEHHRFSREELVNIIKELLYGIHTNCSEDERDRISESVSSELDQLYFDE